MNDAAASTPDLAALRAAAAQAAADAADARAAAAQAALEAAEAALAGAAAPEAPLASWALTVRDGYAFDGPTLPLGALLETGPDGEPVPNPEVQVGLPLAMLNRHGLVAGATGTGKTRTLQGMAESLSAAGVPVFLADVKGDLSGLVVPGTGSDKLLARTSGLGQDWSPTTFPTEFYTLGGLGTGVPIRTTITDFGPLLLSKVMGLNETQESSLGLVFHWADTQGLALLDLKDLRAVIAHLVSDEGKAELKGIGGLSAATAGVLLRELVSLEAQGATAFFGEPAFETADLLRLAPDGRGLISALELPAVQDRPQLFSTFLMWLLADLFSELPEVGDVDKPRLVFFFDEAHLLFNGASKDFLAQIVQTVRLIRSKGVGIFFVTQSPKDVPADVLAQLGNRVQHALRAFTPDDAAALRAAARTYPTSDYDLERLLQELGTGEAVVTVLSEKGAPTPVAWTRLRAPQAAMDTAPATTVEALVAASPSNSRYATAIDNESAYELLEARVAADRAQAEADRIAQEHAEAAEKFAAEQAKAEAKAVAEAEREAKKRAAELEKMRARLEKDAARGSTGSRGRGTAQKSSLEKGLESLVRSAGSQLGREITRTIFGTRKRR
ncbi:helicase HerA-like domain-containing protein [Sanguibacter sp. A247]|uniref:helicase HerA-like domain-containing protein n=1 Tax=unclassified Sanguibacter TaxID=2645534 RepID=UPI003FD7CBA5